MSFRDKNRRDTQAPDKDERAAQEAVRPPESDLSDRPATRAAHAAGAAPVVGSSSAAIDHTELLRRAHEVITYIWGSDPPFKDLADLLSDLKAAVDGPGRRVAPTVPTAT